MVMCELAEPIGRAMEASEGLAMASGSGPLSVIQSQLPCEDKSQTSVKRGERVYYWGRWQRMCRSARFLTPGCSPSGGITRLRAKQLAHL